MVCKIYWFSDACINWLLICRRTDRNSGAAATHWPVFRCVALACLHILLEKEIRAEWMSERTIGGQNVNGSQSKGRHGGNEGRKGHVEVMLAAQTLTTLKLVTYRKGFLFWFPRWEEMSAAGRWNDRRHRLWPAPFFFRMLFSWVFRGWAKNKSYGLFLHFFWSREVFFVALALISPAGHPSGISPPAGLHGRGAINSRYEERCWVF